MPATKKVAVKKTTAKKTAVKKTTVKQTAVRGAAMKKTSGSKTLVVVESPAKAKTIEQYLGKNYTVLASMGHLRDLPKSQFGIDVEHNFEPKYINIRGKGDLIKSLKKEAKQANKVYLASDPDREGEAIAWHLSHILEVDPKEKCRIVFNEITKPAIQAAVKSPKPIDMNRVDAQQARRMLDRIVGYKLSPLLWRKVRRGLSAGRVQSVTVKLICDREKEIQNFTPEEYWTIPMKLQEGKGKPFNAELSRIDGKNPELKNEKDTVKVVEELKKSKFTVKEVKRGTRKRNPAPPFITSSMQQDAANKLGFVSRKTMMIAQQLYEGIAIGKNSVGLITYMRTDSTRISDIAQNEAREYILEAFGEDYVPKTPNSYSSKNAQDAHEAIRPTSMEYAPGKIEQYLTKDQFKLYNLIWQRFIASQMTSAVYDTQSVTIEAGKRFMVKTAGSLLKFKGFKAVYVGAESSKEEKDVVLPKLEAGDALKLVKTMEEQHFTEPPPRYNDASLVKTLEEKDIGRPSTYAPIIETIQARGYVERREKKFWPTELGFIVLDMLEEYFKDIVDVKFTATLENELDEIAEGKCKKNELLQEFYEPFEKTLEEADEAIGHVELKDEESDVKCELCGRMMVYKLGRYGKFLACPGFPECRNTKPILVDTGAKCPKCGSKILERKSRRGRKFYGCEKYPECDFVSWDMPLKEPCKKCGSLMLKHNFSGGRFLLYCINDDCETRINHPINKELAKNKAREEARRKKLEETEKVKPEKKG